MDIFSYFQSALLANARPMLLEFTHPVKKTPLKICGVNPKIILQVRNGLLFRNGEVVGTALDIFRHLKLESSSTFFPAYLGFFSYEFSRYFNKSCHLASHTFPDAYFCLYEEGLMVEEEAPSPLISLPHAGEGGNRRLQTLRPSMSKEAFFDVVREIKRRIRRGEVYQVNFSLPFYFDACAKDLLAIYQSMRINNRSPFMGAVVTDDWWLLSGSPERLFSLNDGVVTARPIAGTKKRGSSQQEDDLLMAELRECPKENAEHAMLVDLMRNDLNQVAKACTVKVDEDRSVEFYSHVMHLVSEVSCETSAGLEEIFRAVLPGGTITGAPKDSVMKTIAELEGTPRGPYTGSLGYISSGFGVDFNILIRSVCGAHDRGWINTGAGIVIDSDENDEWKEVHSKAMAIKEILANRVVAKPLRETARADVERSVDTAVTPRYDTKPKNILFIENHDSFSFNIIDALRALGARVEVARVLANQHSHVVIGPGPGNPSTLPDLWQLIDQVVKRGLPLLGICLGHQAIGHYFGSNIKRVPEPVHGKSHPVIHGGRGLFDGLSSPTTFARYHSLAIEQAPQGFVVDAHTKDDCIMAIRHQDLPIFGVQFHPESYLSHCGQVILRNFLQG